MALQVVERKRVVGDDGFAFVLFWSKRRFLRIEKYLDVEVA